LLRHLRLTSGGSALEQKYVWKNDLELVARAGTQLETLACDIVCFGIEEALALLTKQAPFGALQLEGLYVLPFGDQSAQLLEMLTANLGQQPSLLHLRLVGVRVTPLHNITPFFDALLASQITSLFLNDCNLSVNFAAGFARLLQADRLVRLDLDSCRGMFTPEETAQLSLALRHSCSLRELQISDCFEAEDVLDVILYALESHPTLETLKLGQEFSPAARDALVCVIAANSTRLQTLHLHRLDEDELNLSVLSGALKQNRHLQDLLLRYADEEESDSSSSDDSSLSSSDDDLDMPLDGVLEGISAPAPSAVMEHLLPAVLACTSLRKLRLYGPSAAAVMQPVADREAARLAAERALEPGRSA